MKPNIQKILNELNNLSTDDLNELLKVFNKDTVEFNSMKAKEEWESHVPTYTKKEWEKVVRQGEEPNYVVKIDGILYTMDNYDSVGKEISYANKRLKKQMIIKTSDRYSATKFSDAKIEYDDAIAFRIDFPYYD